MIGSSNPTLSREIFRSAAPASSSTGAMTIEGAVNKSMLAIGLTAATAIAICAWPPAIEAVLSLLSRGGFAALLFLLIAPLGIAITLRFKPALAPTLTPVYAVLEGALLAGISIVFETLYPGIAFQAVMLTFGTLFAMLIAYRSGLIKATPFFKRVLYCAIGGIFIFYMISLVAGLFGYPFTFLNTPSPFSIGFSIVVSGIAAFSLILDFDFIEQAGRSGNAPKYMEWYAAFGLLVTLVWLYIELLRLLSLIQERR